MKRNITICSQDLPPILKQDVEERETCGEWLGVFGRCSVSP